MTEATNGGPSRRTVLGGLVAGVGVAAMSAFVAGCDSKGGKTATGSSTSSNAPASDQSARDGSDANSAKAEAVEKLALQILSMAPVKTAVERGLKTLAASEDATKPDAMRYVKSAMDETATLAALYSAMGGVPDPVFVWLFAGPRKWNGYTLPGSRWYADNTDTLYRGVRVQDTSSYEITVHPGPTLPTQLSVMMYDWLMLENGTSDTTDAPLGTFVVTDKTPRNPDGSITVTAGPEPAGSSPNHLQFKPGIKQIFVREIRGDGSIPAVGLAVKRTKGAAPAPMTLDQLAADAANLIDKGVDATLRVSVVFGKLYENQLAPIRVRWAEGTTSAEQKMEPTEPLTPEKALGFISSALFNLKDDEALVMTLNMLGTEYLSVNTYRPWLVSPEHVYATSSLNNFQAKANPDGSITFVLSPKDPGVYNWLDVGGIPYGEIAVRWQTLTRPVLPTLKEAAPLVKVVKLGNDLKAVLPPETTWVTPEERQEQRDTRAKNYQLRCLGTPCEVGGGLDKPY